MSFAAAIRELDGNTKAAHGARYEAVPVEMPDRTAARVRCTLRLQTRWIRWYAETHPGMRVAAAAAAREIARIADWMERQEGFDRIDPELREQVRAWGEEARSIAAESGRGNEQIPQRALVPAEDGRTGPVRARADAPPVEVAGVTLPGSLSDPEVPVPETASEHRRGEDVDAVVRAPRPTLQACHDPPAGFGMLAHQAAQPPQVM